MSPAGPHWWPAYIGVGSNLDGPREQVDRAIAAIGSLDGCRLTARSSLYRSAPMGPSDQPDYINAVVSIVTTLEPHALLAKLREIEASQGRVRGAERWGPRTLDLDLLVYGRRIIADPDLIVPHPGIAARNFVLLPLAEVAADLRIPGLATVSALVAAIDASAGSIERIER